MITIHSKKYLLKANCKTVDEQRMTVKLEPSLKLWCWRRLLRVPWTARRPNSQS